MPLPPAAPRSPAHTRTVTFRCFAREDGLYDIDATVHDTKGYDYVADRGQMHAGDAMHDLSLRVTLDGDFVIRDIATSMDSTPFGECHSAGPSMRALIGATMGAGWRQTIERTIGGTQGCTHLRELLYNTATAAFQTIPHHRSQVQNGNSLAEANGEKPPFYMGKCLAWRFDGPVVQRIAPKFFNYQPPARSPVKEPAKDPVKEPR